MADLQQILGTMLATGMGGRSGRNVDNIGSVLGQPGMMDTSASSTSAGGGPSFKTTAGLAALGYLAYRAFQERQRNQAQAQTTQAPGQTGDSTWGGGGVQGAGLGGILGGLFGGGGGQAGGGGGLLGDLLSKVFQPGSAPQPADAGSVSAGTGGAFPELAMEDQHALLLIRAMITAANADGEITPDERQHILSSLDEAGAGPEERRVVEHELDNPQPVDTLLQAVRDEPTAEQVYMASVMAVGDVSEAERSYLNDLATRLKVDPQRLQQIRAAA
ncbi:MAG TPA: DUF533 domain-containing protein [Azospirillum sp.]|nr:DUF533 domain-containing protein [Azospirillum sp.]